MDLSPSLRLQDRDFQILRTIGESPACSRKILARLFFNESYEAAKKRVQILIAAGLVDNNNASHVGRTIICLTAKGASVLNANVKSKRPFEEQSVSARMQMHERLLAEC